MSNKKSQLTDGRILRGTTCPYSIECGTAKQHVCNGKGCPVCSEKTTNVDFSCALARGLDMIHRKK